MVLVSPPSVLDQQVEMVVDCCSGRPELYGSGSLLRRSMLITDQRDNGALWGCRWAGQEIGSFQLSSDTSTATTTAQMD